MSTAFTRREWLKTSVLTGAALALMPHGIVAQTTGQPVKPIKLSVTRTRMGFRRKRMHLALGFWCICSWEWRQDAATTAARMAALHPAI